MSDYCSDRDIAIAYLVLMDAEDENSVDSWRAHWEKHFDDMLSSEHSGDCTKQPWTCCRCLAEEAMKMVPVYRKLFLSTFER